MQILLFPKKLSIQIKIYCLVGVKISQIHIIIYLLLFLDIRQHLLYFFFFRKLHSLMNKLTWCHSSIQFSFLALSTRYCWLPILPGNLLFFIFFFLPQTCFLDYLPWSLSATIPQDFVGNRCQMNEAHFVPLMRKLTYNSKIWVSPF